MEESRTMSEIQQELDELRERCDALEQELANTQNERERLKEELQDSRDAYNFWYKSYSECNDKRDAYAKRLERMQHVCKVMGDIIGEVDIKAVVKEDQV